MLIKKFTLNPLKKISKEKLGLQTITMMVTNRADFKPFITLEENGQEVQVTDGAVVSQNLAQLAGVTVGGRAGA